MDGRIITIDEMENFKPKKKDSGEKPPGYQMQDNCLACLFINDDDLNEIFCRRFNFEPDKYGICDFFESFEDSNNFKKEDNQI